MKGIHGICWYPRVPVLLVCSGTIATESQGSALSILSESTSTSPIVLPPLVKNLPIRIAVCRYSLNQALHLPFEPQFQRAKYGPSSVFSR